MKGTLETIHTLRSIHGDFSEKEVSQEDLQTITDACVRAANASARQSYSIIVVNDRQVVKEQFMYNGSKALLFCVDYNRIIKTAAHMGHEFKMDGILSFITGSTDTIMAAQTAALCANAIGIDSLFTNSVHRCDLNKLKAVFDLPDKYCFPLIALILGYAKNEPAYQKGRLTGNGVVHYEKYHEPGGRELDELISIYDDPQIHMGLIDDWKEKAYTHYLDWFYKVWCKDGNIEKQEEVLSVLHQAGFIHSYNLRI